MQTHKSVEVAFHGEYREVVPNERLVSSEIFEGVPDEARDAHLAAGMEGGLAEALDLLQQLVG